MVDMDVRKRTRGVGNTLVFNGQLVSYRRVYITSTLQSESNIRVTSHIMIVHTDVSEVKINKSRRPGGCGL